MYNVRIYNKKSKIVMAFRLIILPFVKLTSFFILFIWSSSITVVVLVFQYLDPFTHLKLFCVTQSFLFNRVILKVKISILLLARSFSKQLCRRKSYVSKFHFVTYTLNLFLLLRIYFETYLKLHKSVSMFYLNFCRAFQIF